MINAVNVKILLHTVFTGDTSCLLGDNTRTSPRILSVFVGSVAMRKFTNPHGRCRYLDEK